MKSQAPLYGRFLLAMATRDYEFNFEPGMYVAVTEENYSETQVVYETES